MQRTAARRSSPLAVPNGWHPRRVPRRLPRRILLGPSSPDEGRPMPLSEEQNLMRASCRAFVDDLVIPFIRGNWQREWDMNPDTRLPAAILQGADTIRIGTVGVPEAFGGIELEPGSVVPTFARISELFARGVCGRRATRVLI